MLGKPWCVHGTGKQHKNRPVSWFITAVNWEFPEIGVLPIIIHLCFGFSMK